jgi:HEAT repeat protein
MTETRWPLLALTAVTLGCCSLGCGPATSQTTASGPAHAVQRLAEVRETAVAGPDAEGAIDALVKALSDEDDTVQKVAAVGLLSFGEKAVPALRKKMPPRDTAPSKIPNPQKAPYEVYGVADFIVELNPRLFLHLLPAAEEVAQDKNPALRVVGVRALATAGDPRSERIRDDLRAAEKDPDERVRKTAQELLKRLGD